MNRLQIQNYPKILDTIISDFLSSKHYQEMLESDEYYEFKNKVISERQKKMMLYENKELVVNGISQTESLPYLVNDLSKANHKIIHGYHYELIKQCTDYLSGRPIRISWKDDVVVSPMIKEKIDEILYRDNSWGKFNQKNISNAQKYKYSFSRLVIDAKGKLRLVNVDSKQVIHFLDDYGQLECVIRLFSQEEYDSKGVKNVVEYAEVYDETYKDIYVKKGGKYEFYNQETLLYIQNSYENDDNEITAEITPVPWNKIPWIMWKFNDDEIDALRPIKTFIDILDLDLSDLANNIDDIQDAIWILENYQGQSIEEFMEDLKIKKAINVGEGGSVDRKTLEIPHEARMKLYETCEKNIYKFGRGIDFSRRDDLGNSTGVALKWSYGPLDQKADEIEEQGQEALNTLFDLLLQYIDLTHVNVNDYINSNSVEFIFDRTLITNEKEKVEMLLGSTSMISRQTIVENHPFVPDSEVELKRLNEDILGATPSITGGNTIVEKSLKEGEVNPDEVDKETARNKRALSFY